ncbi:MAG: integrase core domain-containing protein [bacterium]
MVFREKYFETVGALQQELDQWLNHYNHERPHQGYRNRGNRPIDTVEQYLKLLDMKISYLHYI